MTQPPPAITQPALWQQVGLVIFDCDGTLVDSLASITHVMNLAVRQVGLADHLSPRQVGEVVGLSMTEAMTGLFPTAPEALCQEAIRVYKDHYKQLADSGALQAPLFPGARETLDRLRQAGMPLAMATGKSMRGVDRTLREHDLVPYFQYLKSADCAPSKPDPGMIRQIIEESGLPPHRVLMVGDTDFDIRMGHAAGVHTAAITHGCHARERLQAAHPERLLTTLPELLPLLGLT